MRFKMDDDNLILFQEKMNALTRAHIYKYDEISF
jgi:hypothetical protein